MSEFVQEGGVQAAEVSPEAAADAGGAEWSGPSPEEWQQTREALGQIASLLVPEEEQAPGFDPFAEDGGLSQIQALLDDKLAPIAQVYEQLQEQAAVEEGEQEAERLVGELAAELGAHVDGGAVRDAAHSDVVAYASQLMADAGYSPPQIRAALASDAMLPYDLLAKAYNATRQEVARTALETRIRGDHFEATRERGPSGVLKRWTQTQQPARAAVGGPRGLLAKRQREQAGRRT